MYFEHKIETDRQTDAQHALNDSNFGSQSCAGKDPYVGQHRDNIELYSIGFRKVVKASLQ